MEHSAQSSEVDRTQFEELLRDHRDFLREHKEVFEGVWQLENDVESYHAYVQPMSRLVLSAAGATPVSPERPLVR